MHRRGPDAQGLYHNSPAPECHVLLLHTRLAIIDLDHRSHQPFRQGPRVMVYNGELYNYLELKNNLEGEGNVFTTTGDTEVLLRILEADDFRGLNSARGMWALAIYDESSEALTLCRDIFGEKPLYYYQDASGFYFGSEPKFIFALLGRRLAVNFQQVQRYLAYGYRALYQTPETFFQGLFEVPPGHLLHIDQTGVKPAKPYWGPTLFMDHHLDWPEAVAGVRVRLIESVRQKLRADVPLAFCMSGGLDSNALISVATRILDYDVHGFTIINQDERYAEQDLVTYAVKELGIKHTAVTLEPSDFLPNMKTLVRAHDSPVSTVTYYAHWWLMEAMARHGYKIAVSGTGADELLAGYYDHHLWYLYETRHDDHWAKSYSDWETYIKPLVRNPLYRDVYRFMQKAEAGQRDPARDFDFSMFLTGSVPQRPHEKIYHPGPLRNRMLNELFHESVPVILHEDDLNAMYFSIENRSPFLDRNLMEFAYQVPTRYLIGRGYNKHLLRTAMEGIVPPEILASRVKIGFNAPISALLPTNDPQVRNQLLDDGPIFQVVDRTALVQLLDRKQVFDKLNDQESAFLFYFLSARLFVEEFGGAN